jgi:prepilin-type N-terminal cleavage/methylation domain-containing protein
MRRPLTSAAAKPGRSRGFTLLEVLLALALASLVLAALAMCIDFHLRAADTSRNDVEQAQLARVLLGLIADDLRGVVVHRPIDYDELASSGGSSSTSGGEGGESSEESEADQLEDLFAEESDLAAEDLWLDETYGEAAAGVPQSVPGIYGGADWIQVDVARLPRLEQLESLLTPTEDLTATARLSDTRTVAYYVVSADEAGATLEGEEPSGGLVRCELDRASSLLASELGTLEEPGLDHSPIAPEVTAIEFRYSDGTEWLDYWDSEESGGLPMAVEIIITIRRTQGTSSRYSSPTASSQEDLLEEEGALTCRFVVHIPAAEPSSGEEIMEGMEGMEEMTGLE